MASPVASPMASPMASPLPWFYVYSQRYEAFHHLMKDSVTDPRLQLKPLFVEQEEFNKVTYHSGADHFLSGCFIKQELCLELLKKLPKDSYFLFTDVDFVFLRQELLFDFFKGYMDRGVDMAYMWEPHNKEDPRCNCNVGFSLLRANESTIAFFEKVVKKGRETTDLYDREIMTPLFSEFPEMKIEVLDRAVICLSNMYAETNPREGIAMVQILCGNTKDYKMNLKQKYYGVKLFGKPMDKYLHMALASGRTMEELGLS